MKICNAPAKVFSRRLNALQRLKSTSVCGNGSKKQRLNSEITESMILHRQSTIREELASLENSLNIAGSPRNIRSKKDHSAKARISY